MITLPEYIKIYDLVSIYLDNADALLPVRAQHFAARLALCSIAHRDMPDISSVVSVARDRARDISEHYGKGDFDYIVDEYVCPPYRVSGKERVLDWIRNADTYTRQYLSLGALSAELFILVRNDAANEINWDEIYNIYKDIDEFVRFHNTGAAGLRDVNGTLYVNFIGNAFFLLNNDTLEFTKHIELEDWRKTREWFVKRQFTTSNIYGVTHVIINATQFYTMPLDNDEYRAELEYLDRFLKELRSNRYADVDEEYTYDVVCEAALCERLAGDPRYAEWVYTKGFLLDSISPSTRILQSVHGYENNFEKNLEHNEHCNILLVMLCRYVARM